MNAFFHNIRALFALVVLGIIICGLGFIVYRAISLEVSFWQAPAFYHEAILLNKNFSPSTSHTRFAPVLSGKGTAIAVYSTGHDEIYTTIWDCGEYGILTSDNQEVFRFSSRSNVLRLKKVRDEVRVIGIKH